MKFEYGASSDLRDLRSMRCVENLRNAFAGATEKRIPFGVGSRLTTVAVFGRFLFAMAFEQRAIFE